MASLPLLIVDAVWLLLLAVGYAVLRREVAIVDWRTRLSGSSVPDGLDIGVAIPRAAGNHDGRLLLFLFGDCGSCHELAGHLDGLKERSRLEVVVRDGARPGAAASVLSRLPPDVATHSGEAATRLNECFKVRSGPIAFAVHKGVVVAKGYVRHTDDIRRLDGIDVATRRVA